MMASMSSEGKEGSDIACIAAADPGFEDTEDCRLGRRAFNVFMVYSASPFDV